MKKLFGAVAVVVLCVASSFAVINGIDNEEVEKNPQDFSETLTQDELNLVRGMGKDTVLVYLSYKGMRKTWTGNLVGERAVQTVPHFVGPDGYYLFQTEDEFKTALASGEAKFKVLFERGGKLDATAINVEDFGLASSLNLRKTYSENYGQDIMLLKLSKSAPKDYRSAEVFVANPINDSKVGNGKLSFALCGTGRKELHSNTREGHKSSFIWRNEEILAAQLMELAQEGVFTINQNKGGGCYGDSGSGLRVKNSSGQWKVFGVQSYATENCGEATFTPVYLHAGWLAEKFSKWFPGAKNPYLNR